MRGTLQSASVQAIFALCERRDIFSVGGNEPCSLPQANEMPDRLHWYMFNV